MTPTKYHAGYTEMVASFRTKAAQYEELFIRKDGQDVRTLPKVKHPSTGMECFDWGAGYWPQSAV